MRKSKIASLPKNAALTNTSTALICSENEKKAICPQKSADDLTK
jgi:hypothetical protein